MSVTDATANASDLQTQFMTLLVTQLQNQNPLEPMDNKDMSAQLAQFSQLEQMESMNNSFTQVLDSVQKEYASSLIGKDISFATMAEDGSEETQTGAVEEVLMEDGEMELIVGDYQVSLADVLSVRG
jgi:flagellar basal-body rod modification protein FlgD